MVTKERSDRHFAAGRRDVGGARRQQTGVKPGDGMDLTRIAALAVIVGGLLVSVGAWLVHPAAGLIIAGLLIAAGGITSLRETK